MAMKDEKVMGACRALAEILMRRGGAWACARHGAPENHLLWMIMGAGGIPDLVHEGRREKAMRWLGFAQGAVWARGWVTLDELKAMNAPDGAELEVTGR